MRAWIERHQILAVSLAAGAGFILWELRGVVIVLFLGYILAAALRPAVDLLDRVLPRVLAILLIYIVLFAALFGLIIPLAFSLSGQIGDFSSQIMEYVGGMGTTGILNSFGFSVSSLTSWAGQHALSFTTSAAAALTGIVSAIIISIYLLYDWHGLHRSLAQSSYSAAVRIAEALAESERMLGSWVRGQLLLSAIVGVLVFIALTIIGVPSAPLLGVLSGFTELIPYIGPFLGAAPGIMIALNISTTKSIIVLVAYILIQQIENHLLVPIIMHRSVEMHPVTVIVVMLAGFELLGFVGVILAVPFAALVRVAAVRIWYA